MLGEEELMPSGLTLYTRILPHVVLAIGIVATLLAAAFTGGRSRKPLIVAAVGLAAALLSVGRVLPLVPGDCTPLFRIDGISLFATGLMLLASLSIALMAFSYLKRLDERTGEFAVLLLLGTLGGLVLASTNHFLSLFLGIELIGIPLAVMAAYIRSRNRSIEAGFKYIVLSGVSSALLLFGIALLYAETGSLGFGPTAARIAASGVDALLSAGFALVLAGLGFKLALAPFHFWSPDVYEGAPAPVTTFAATVSKTAAAVALLRIVPPSLISNDRFLLILLTSVSVASMVLGTVQAVRQRNVKRLLAYSSIAHTGYLIIPFLAAAPRLSMPAVLFYLAFSVVTNLASFGVVTVLSGKAGDAEDLDDYAGLSWRKPWIAAVFTISVLSLLGVPLTAGFMAKFYVVAAAMESMRLLSVLTLAVTTAVSAFYYIRLIMTMFLGRAEIQVHALRHVEQQPSVAGVAVIGLQAAVIVWLGVSPQFFLRLIEKILS